MNQRKERPILFSGAMVRAILDGRKTQTRRILKPQPMHPGFASRHTLATDDEGQDLYVGSATLASPIRCPYGKPGDRLWVREAFMHEPADYCWEASVSIPARPATTIYRADSDPHGEAKGCGWKPSIHMPRALSRITLEITGVRVERLKDCSERDAVAEGLHILPASGRYVVNPGEQYFGAAGHDPRVVYADLWDRINGAGAWEANPWVWVVEFKRL